MKSGKNLSQTSESPKNQALRLPTSYPAFFLHHKYEYMNKEILHVCSHRPWHFLCRCLVSLTSELLKLTHANAFKDFYLSQHSANGVTGYFLHTNEFLKNLNPLICEVSGHQVIASNCYHPFYQKIFLKTVCPLLSELSVPLSSSALPFHSVFSVSL